MYDVSTRYTLLSVSFIDIIGLSVILVEAKKHTFNYYILKAEQMKNLSLQNKMPLNVAITTEEIVINVMLFV